MKKKFNATCNNAKKSRGATYPVHFETFIWMVNILCVDIIFTFINRNITSNANKNALICIQNTLMLIQNNKHWLTYIVQLTELLYFFYIGVYRDTHITIIYIVGSRKCLDKFLSFKFFCRKWFTCAFGIIG